MERFIPYEKLSKKKKRELDAQKRGSWGAMSPVTRRSKDPRAYDRRKARRIPDDGSFPCFFGFGDCAGRSARVQ